MIFAVGKTYQIAGFPGEWRVTEMEYIKPKNYITLIRFSRNSDGLKKVVRNIDDKDLALSVKEIKEKNR